MAEKSRNNGKLNFILLVLAVVGAALFYGCGGVNSDIVPEAQCLITGTIKPSATLESYLLSSLRGVTADMSGCKVWVEADGYGSAVYTDENGNYTITTRPTTSRIVAEYASTNGNTYIVWSNQQSFVRKVDTNQVDNMTLKIANISIKGRIISSNGASVSGSNVGVSILGKTIYPDENGIYTLPLMPEDSVETLTINGGGYQAITQTVTFSENSPLIENTVVTNSETNRAPIITSISNKSQNNVKKQQTVLLQVNFSDPDLNIATWSWSVMPSDGASIGSFTSQEGDRSLTYSKVEWRAPDNDTLATITFTVTDTKGLTAKSLFFFNVGNGIPNNPPQILSINKVRTSEGADEDDNHIQGREKYTFTALAYDADAEDMVKLRYSWKCEYNGVNWTDGFDTEKNGATSASTIDFIAKGATQTNRIATVTVGVYDGKSSWIYKSQQYIVTQEEANSAPVITLATITAYTETKWPYETSVLSMNGGLAKVSTMSKYRINVVATDANGDKLRYYFGDTATGTNNREEIKAEYEGLSDLYIPSTIWTAPRYASNELLLATITIKVCDEDPLDNELIRSITTYNLNVKIASNPAKIKAPYIKFGDFANKWGKKGEQATFTAEIHEENESGPAKQLKQYKWRYIYRANQVTIPNDANEEADGDGKTTWKNIITANNGWKTAKFYSTPLNSNATFTEELFTDAFASEVGTGTYFVKLIAQDTDGLFTSKVATFTINASPTVSLEVIGITSSGAPSAGGSYADVNNPTSNIWVVNEGCGVIPPNADKKGSIKVRATIRDNSYDTQHKAYFTYGNASYTVNVGNSGAGIVRTTNSNGTVATVEYTKEIADSWNVTAGNNITVEVSAQEHTSVNALEEIAATATVDVYYNKKPDVGDSPISISDSLIQYEGYNCYIVGRDTPITAILTTSDDVDGELLGYGRGRVVWKVGSINAAGNVSYGSAIASNIFTGSPAANMAGTVTFTDFSAFSVGTYTLRAEITDSYGAVNVATSPIFIVAKDSSIAFNPTPSIPANVDLNNNTNPTYVTYGTSFKMKANYTVGGANGTPANVEYKYKLTTADDSQYTNFTSVTQDPLGPTVSASINTTDMAASYSYNVSVVATGNHGEVASAAYTIMLNTPPDTPTVILTPTPAPAVNNGIYTSGTTFALKATINDPEDFQDMTVHTIKASEAPTGAKLEFWYSTDDGAHTTKINSPDAWQPAANNHSYQVIASYTDKYKSHVASYTEIRVSNSPTVTFKAETAQYNKKYYSKTTSAPTINLNFTVNNLDSEDEIKHESGNLTGIKWYYTNVTTGVTTSFTPSRVNDGTATTKYPNYWYQFAGQTAGTYTYKVEVELETGIVGSSTITPVCINQIPTAGSVEMTIGSPIQGNIYHGTDDLTFSVTENDEDADDMPTFKWEAIRKKDGAVVQTETHTYTPTGPTYQKLTGATSVTDTFKWSNDVTLANIGSYTVRVTITDRNGPAHSEQVVAEKEVVRDSPIVIGSFNGPDYIYPAGDNTPKVFTATVTGRTASTLNSSFTFGDGDNPNTSITGTISNAGSNITNTIQYNQFSSSVGTKTMLITVSDECGMVATAPTKVYVNAKPTLGTVTIKDSTSAPTTSIETGANFSIESSSNDGDPKDNITFRLSIDAVTPANYTTPYALTSKLVTDETTNKTLVLNSTEIAGFSPKSGKYTFALVAEDSYGISSEKQTAVLTINKLPTVSFTASPSSSEKYDGKDAFLETGDKSVSFTATVNDTASENYTYSWFSGVTSILAGPSSTKTSLTDSQSFTVANVGMASYSVIVKDPLEETAIATKSIYVFRKIQGTSDANAAVKDIVTNVQDNSHHYFVFVNGDLSKTTGAYLYDFPTDTSIVVPSSYIASYSDVSQDRDTITADTWTPKAVCAAVRPNGNLVTYATDPSHKLYIYNLNMTAVAGNAPTASGTRITTGPTVAEPSPDKSFAKIAASNSQIWGWVSNSDNKIYKISESGIVTETSRAHNDVTNMRAFGDYLYVVAGGSVTKYNASSLNPDAGGTISITGKVIVDIYDATNHYFLLTKDGHIYIYRKSDKTTTDLNCSTTLGNNCKSLCFFTTSDGGYLLALGATKLCAVSLGLPVNGSSLSTW